jgi:hypothetical protein
LPISWAGDLVGVPTQFASLDDFIATKEATARPDEDVPDLERLRALRDRDRG